MRGVDLTKYFIGPIESLDKNSLLYVNSVSEADDSPARYLEVKVMPYLSRKEINIRHNDLDAQHAVTFSTFTP